ncbi:diguanylate cyclase with PAS/PAC and Chase2 sensors [Calothrix sp. NIES-4071]|nr:diguanylate cyclase with PAS/PAC and Chase2 sensors [Calothrix sp. NIES-4071]BAZ56046.1 diguanylate cyclase with PAS/PAC and Chase2 sensors [Calothrix sp. NIES-4105]
MSKQGYKFLQIFRSKHKESLLNQRELFVSFGVASSIIVLRALGFFQLFEWSALDVFFQLRPIETYSQPITIVAVDEISLRNIGTWPIPDGEIARALTKLNKYKPRAIGLDIYRDFKVNPGYEQLAAAYQNTPNLVGIEKLSLKQDNRVLPPINLNPKQVGFNNILLDGDAKVRRSLLYWHTYNKKHESFALKIALQYLKAENIKPKAAQTNSKYLQLGHAVFRRFLQNDGSYIGADNRGYQIISNFPKPSCKGCEYDNWGFPKVSLSDLLKNQVPEKLIKDRIILIGSTAPSLQDYVQIPYSNQLTSKAKTITGVELQAYFISELISAALYSRPLIKVWPDLVEFFWIFVCTYLGVVTRYRINSTTTSFLVILLSCCVLTGSAFLIFIDGWWIPLVPGLVSLWSSVFVVTCQITYVQEELKRSKEFLDQIINTIPDPVFVKNNKHQWIVLNEAYCEFLGYPKEILLEKSDYDYFPKSQANLFRSSDDLVFKTQQPCETEEEFTDRNGNTYSIATKRSLHKDAAGNCYLVGVIRDITKRKLIEEDLKRSFSELYRSNHELKTKQDRLQYLASHDPLTGLPNRKLFTEQLEESLYWAKNNSLMIGLLFIDLDGFKKVNDTLGHEMGDRLLITVASRLNNCLRGSDTVARLGGDEFTVILRAIPNEVVAAKVAEKILLTITEPILLDGKVAKVSASIGISIYPLNSHDSKTLINQADAAMYRAKHMGKNRYEFS